MNKYQEALNNLENIICDLSCELKQDYELYPRETGYEKYSYILQELVDKATPKKVLEFTSEVTNSEEAYTFYTCPKCRMLLSNDVYCPKCGQALDWSDEEMEVEDE